MHERAVPEVFDLCQKVRAEVKKFKYSEEESRALVRQVNLRNAFLIFVQTKRHKNKKTNTRPHMKNLHVILDSPAEWSTTVKMLSRMSQLEEAYLAYAEDKGNPSNALTRDEFRLSRHFFIQNHIRQRCQNHKDARITNCLKLSQACCGSAPPARRFIRFNAEGRGQGFRVPSSMGDVED